MDGKPHFLSDLELVPDALQHLVAHHHTKEVVEGDQACYDVFL